MAACEVAVAVVMATQFINGTLSHEATVGLIVVVCVFIAGHAWGWGPMAWLVCSEVQPMHTRAAGTALATGANFLLSFLVGQAFLPMLCAMKWGVFLFFAGGWSQPCSAAAHGLGVHAGACAAEPCLPSTPAAAAGRTLAAVHVSLPSSNA
jgi:hypothetical protein